MKHLKKFNESLEEDFRNEILDNFLYITDILGEPSLTNVKYLEPESEKTFIFLI